MFTKTITYKDYRGVERTEEFQFNLNQSELMEMNREYDGGMAEILRKIINAKNVKEIIGIIKEMILRSYGEISLDGKRFVKSKELSEAFAQTEAYNMLYMELVGDADKAAEFMNKIVPAELAAEAQKYISEHGDDILTVPMAPMT